MKRKRDRNSDRQEILYSERELHNKREKEREIRSKRGKERKIRCKRLKEIGR